jgi:hypothetical protein
MTFDEFRQKVGAMRYAAIDAPGFYTLPEMTLSQLRELVGAPAEQKINDVGIAYVAYNVDGGTAVTVARVNAASQVLDHALLFLKPNDPPGSTIGQRQPTP